MPILKRPTASASSLLRSRKCAGSRLRRYASTEHGQGDAHHSEASSHESLGKGFYITLAVVPLSLAAFKFSRSGDEGTQPLFTRIIEGYKGYKQSWTDRNTLHTDMIEQAAFDRNLFQSARGSRTVELRFPEIFNTGSPYNVIAGQGGANLDNLIAHYENRNRDVEEAKVKALEQREKKQ